MNSPLTDKILREVERVAVSEPFKNNILLELIAMGDGDTKNLNREKTNYHRGVKAIMQIIDEGKDLLLGFTVYFNEDFSKIIKLNWNYNGNTGK